MAADHPRLKVMKSLTTLLEGINPTNDYENDLRDQVWRGRTTFGSEQEGKSFVSILDVPRIDFSLYAGQGQARADGWVLLLQGFVKTVGDHPTDPLYGLLAEVEERMMHVVATKSGTGNGLYPEFYMLPDEDGQPQIASLELSQPIVRPPQSEPVAEACFFLQVRIGLARPVG